jgi:hypothetical protein
LFLEALMQIEKKTKGKYSTKTTKTFLLGNLFTFVFRDYLNSVTFTVNRETDYFIFSRRFLVDFNLLNVFTGLRNYIRFWPLLIVEWLVGPVNGISREVKMGSSTNCILWTNLRGWDTKASLICHPTNLRKHDYQETCTF